MIAGTLEVQMRADMAALKKDMADAKNIVGGAAADMQKAFGLAKTALEGLVAGLTVHAFVEFVRGAIDAADHLNDLSKKTGIAVEELGGLGFAAKQSGGNLESMAEAAGKLNRAIAGSAAGNKEQAEAFKVLGVNVKESSGNLKSADQVMVELANKFEKFEDGPNKVALAIRLFGKAGADIIPILDEGGQKLLENIEYYKRYSGVTKDVAQRSDEFNDTLEKIHLLSGALGTKIASALLDPLQALANHMLEAKENSQAFEKTAEVLSTVFKGLSIYASAFATTMQLVGQTIAGVAAMQDRLIHLDPRGALNVFKEMSADNVKAVTDAKKFMDSMLRTPTAEEIQDRESGGVAALRQGRRQQAPGLTDPAAAARELKLYENAVRKLEDELGKLNNQTEVEKLTFEMYGKSVTLADGSVVHLTGSLEQLAPAHKRMLPIIAAEVDLRKQAKQASDEALKFAVAVTAEQERSDAALGNYNTTLSEQLKQLEFEATLVGKLDLQRDQAIALRALDLDYAKKVAAADREENVNREQELATLKALYDTQKEALPKIMELNKAAQVLNKKNIEQIQFETTLIGLNTTEREQAIAVRALELTGIDKNTQAFKDYVEQLKGAIAEKNFAQESQTVLVGMWQEVDRVAHDTFSSMFDKGADTFKRLRDTLKQTLVDMLFKLTVRPILIQIVAGTAGSGAAQQVFGAAATGADGTGGGGGGLGGLFNLASLGNNASQLFGGNSLFNSLSGFLGLGAGGATAAAGLLGTSALAGGALGTGLGSAGIFGGLGAGGSIGTGLGSAGIFGSLGAGEAAAGAAAFGSAGFGAAGTAATGALSAIGTALPYIGIAIAVASMLGLFGGSKKIPAVGLGGNTQIHDFAGAMTTQYDSPYGGDANKARSIVDAMYDQFNTLSKALGAKYDQVLFTYDANSGHNSENPNFAIQSNLIRNGAGSEYTVGEHVGSPRPLDDATLKLEASRAVIAALKASELPDYLRKTFDAIPNVGGMSQQDIDNFSTFLTQLQALHELLPKIAELSGFTASFDQLMDIFGNAQTALPMLQAYYENFFTDNEKHAQSVAAVEKMMTDLGVVTLPKTRAEFRALIEAQDLSTDAGKQMFQSLISVSGAFAAVTDAIDATADAALSLQDQLTQASTDATQLIQDQIGASRDAAKAAHDAAETYRQAGINLRDAARQLRQGDLSPLLPGQKLAESRGNLDDVFQRALSGDKTALSSLPQVAQDFLRASRDFNASSQAYSADFERVMSMLEQAGMASDTFGGAQDYLATTLDVQTGVLQDILDTLKDPSPDLDKLQEQVDLLATVRDLIADSGRNLLTINSSITDQTGHVISGNSMIDTQTGEIVALPRLISSFDYTVLDPQLRGTLNVNDADARTQAQQLLSANGPLAAGQYAIQTETGRVVSATVDQSGIVTQLRELTRDQTGRIDVGTTLLSARTGEVVLANTTLNTTTGTLVQGVNRQTGEVVAGNSTTDAIRNLTARDTTVSEQMLIELARNSSSQSSQFATMVDGLQRTVDALNTLIGLQQDFTEEEARRQAAEAAAAAKAAQIATNQASLSSAVATRNTLTASVNTGIQGIRDLATRYGLQLQADDGSPAYFRVNQQTGAFESNYQQLAGDPAYFEGFKGEFWAPGGVYDQTFGKASQLSALGQQIQTLRDLITSLGATPSHAGGLNYVPYDNYLAKLHRGETVLTSSEASAYRADSRSYSGGGAAGGFGAVCDEIRQLREEVRTLREQGSRDAREQTAALAGAFIEGSIKGAREQSQRADNARSAQARKSR